MEPVKPTEEQIAQRIARVKRYVEMRAAKPLRRLDDCIHTIHTGTEWAGELNLADLRALLDDWQTRGKDSERLDWLGKQGDSNGWYVQVFESGVNVTGGHQRADYAPKNTLREALDAAMQKGTTDADNR